MKEIHISEIEHLDDKESFIKGLFSGENLDVCFHYESYFGKTQLLRDIIDMIAGVCWLDDKWRRRIVLIVDELNNNAIEYGSQEGDINKMKFSFKKDTHTTLSIEVEDSWAGKQAKNANTMKLLQAEKMNVWFDNHASIRWRGLFMIIVNLVDDLYFKDSDRWWLVVWVKKSF